MSMINATLYAQSSGIISGVVTDGESGEPGIGVNVMVKGTLLGSFTRFDGTYVIPGVPAGDQTLVFTSVGFERYEKPVTVIAGQESKEDIKLNVLTTVLGEVLVSGLRKSQISSGKPALSFTPVILFPKPTVKDNGTNGLQPEDGFMEWFPVFPLPEIMNTGFIMIPKRQKIFPCNGDPNSLFPRMAQLVKRKLPTSSITRTCVLLR